MARRGFRTGNSQTLSWVVHRWLTAATATRIRHLRAGERTETEAAVKARLAGAGAVSVLVSAGGGQSGERVQRTDMDSLLAKYVSA